MRYDDVSRRWWMNGAVCLVIGAAALALSGCSMDDRKSPDDSTTRAMADPMGYSPDRDPSITGGGLTDFDSKAFKRDLDHVLNP